MIMYLLDCNQESFRVKIGNILVLLPSHDTSHIYRTKLQVVQGFAGFLPNERCTAFNAYTTYTDGMSCSFPKLIQFPQQ